MYPLGRRHRQITVFSHVVPTLDTGVKWQGHVKNVDIADRTGLQTLQIKSAIGTKHCLVTLLDWMPPHLHTERYVRSLQ